jgi:hypothetical protein
VAADRLSIYRHNVRRNYRGALGSTFPVVKALVGAAFFDAAVDAFVDAHPSTSGDLNGYGNLFDAFLEDYAPARPLPYLPDVARLEWAIDDVHRAEDVATSPEDVLAAIAAVPAARLAGLCLRITPACRLVGSGFPILRIWRTNQRDFSGDRWVNLDEGGDCVLVRRDAAGIPLDRIDPGDHTFLSSLAAGFPLSRAVDRATLADPAFDLAAALRANVASSTIVGIRDDALSGSGCACDQ